MTTQCKHADSGCNYPEGECLGVCMGKKSSPWIQYNPMTHTYDSKDGTHVPAELAENVHCLADALQISCIREAQRTTAVKAQGSAT